MNVTDFQPVVLPVSDDLSVTIIPHNSREWLMTTTEVANAYGVSKSTIWSHHSNHAAEFVEGQHFIKGLENFKGLSNQQPTQVYWTKAGVIRLGFHIKSDRARMFRDWAEQVILAVTAPKVSLPKPTRRNHNRLTNARLVELLALVAMVDDKALRQQIIGKLIPDMEMPAVQLQLPLGNKNDGL